MSYYLESTVTATLSANGGSNYQVALGIGITLDEEDRTASTLVAGSTVYKW